MSVLCLLFIFSAAAADEVKPDDIVGVWLIEEDGEAVEKVEIYRCGGMYCGKIVWLKSQEGTDTPVTDEKNKSEELRDRPLLGLEVLQGYEFDGENSWHDGNFYAYRKGKTVSPKLTLVDGNHLKIQVKILFIKKSFVWKRVLAD
jgi:uncharacterized protein (DUF2147 family)